LPVVSYEDDRLPDQMNNLEARSSLLLVKGTALLAIYSVRFAFRDQGLPLP